MTESIKMKIQKKLFFMLSKCILFIFNWFLMVWSIIDNVVVCLLSVFYSNNVIFNAVRTESNIADSNRVS